MIKQECYRTGPLETNMYLLYDTDTKDGVIIDPGVYDMRAAEYIEKNGIGIKYTINTHGHYDHIGGNKQFGYPVLIHEKDKDCLSNPIRSLSVVGGMNVRSVKPFKLLKDGDIIAAGSLSFKVIHTPGHTPGSISLEFGKILFTGDTLFCEGIGRTDLPFSNTRDIERSVGKLLRYNDDTVFYPGHGPSSTIGHERKNNPYLGF